jgi:glycogen(starch) synthase
MNVLLISYEFPPHNATGGIGSYMFHLAKLLSKNGHHVFVFSGNPLGIKMEKEETGYCTNFIIPSKTNEEFSKKGTGFFEDFIRENTVDVMESPEVGACALEIKKRFPQIPLIVKMHTPGVLITKISHSYQSFYDKARFVAGALLRGKKDLGYWSATDANKLHNPEYEICELADVLLTPSQALKKWAVNYWQLPESEIRVVPNPFSIDDGLFLLPVENRPKVISFVGKLSILKGMIALTEAIPVILEKNDGYTIYLVGRDETENGHSMKEYMEEKLSAYSGRILFTGSLPAYNLKEIYAQSQVCIFPSLWENYPTVILEAMASGAAVAASNAGGIPEIIENNTTGILFDPKKSRQIEQAVCLLLKNQNIRLKMAYEARKSLQNRVSDWAFEEKILEVYDHFSEN